MGNVVKVILAIVIIVGCVAFSAVIYYGLAYGLLWAISQFMAIEVTRKTIIATAIILWILSLIFGSKAAPATKKD